MMLVLIGRERFGESIVRILRLRRRLAARGVVVRLILLVPRDERRGGSLQLRGQLHVGAELIRGVRRAAVAVKWRRAAGDLGGIRRRVGLPVRGHGDGYPVGRAYSRRRMR